MGGRSLVEHQEHLISGYEYVESNVRGTGRNRQDVIRVLALHKFRDVRIVLLQDVGVRLKKRMLKQM